MTTRAQILALAADYDTAPTKIAKAVRREALVEAITSDRTGLFVTPSTDEVWASTKAVRLWAVASRRTGKPGRPPSDRTHRLDVPATTATRDAIHAHATRTGKSRATVAGDFLEVGAIAATSPPKGDGASHE